MGILYGMRALITGGLRTIVRAMATRIAEDGASAPVLDRADAEDGAAGAAAAGPGIGVFGRDFNHQDGAERALATETRGLDILFTNAALVVNKPHENYSCGECEDQGCEKSSAAFALAQAARPHMKAQGYGRVADLTSRTPVGQRDGYVPHVARKGGMPGRTKGLVREPGPHRITVNVIAPGAVVSEAEEHVLGDRLQHYDDWNIERRCLETRIESRGKAGLALLPCSPAARTKSRHHVGIDAGW